MKRPVLRLKPNSLLLRIMLGKYVASLWVKIQVAYCICLNFVTSHAHTYRYPKELLDDEKLSELYADLEMDDGHFFRNSARIAVWKVNKEWKKLREKVNNLTMHRIYFNGNSLTHMIFLFLG